MKNKVVFFNPYESSLLVTGTVRRIQFLISGLKSADVEATSFTKEDYNSRVLIFISHTPVLRRLLYFLHVFLLLAKGYVVVTEVVFSPVWNKNLYLTIHDMKAFTTVARRGGGWKKYLYGLLIKRSKNIITVSEFTKRELIEFCKLDERDISVIPNGISRSRIDFIVNIPEKEKEYDYVYVSSFAKHKRHCFLLNSLPKNKKILFIGRDFGELESITRLASENNMLVDIRNDVDGDFELFSLIKSAKVALFPSAYEGFGIPVLEYYASGVYSIVSDIPPFKELSSYVGGFHVVDDKESLLSEIKKIKDNRFNFDVRTLEEYSEINISQKLISTIFK